MIKTIILALIIVCQANIEFCESNEIHSFKVIKQTSNSVLVELKYYYSGDHGDKAELTAWPLPSRFLGVFHRSSRIWRTYFTVERNIRTKSA